MAIYSFSSAFDPLTNEYIFTFNGKEAGKAWMNSDDQFLFFHDEFEQMYKFSTIMEIERFLKSVDIFRISGFSIN